MSKEKEKSLYNTENYNKTFDFEDIHDYVNKYSVLINEYINLVSESIFIQDPGYFKFIIERGIETLQHIYTLLIMYTKNLDLTYFHCQKAYYYYIEFIGQIGNDSHSFLQLNSKDATLFVYKKTICDVNTDYRKKMEINEKETSFIETIKQSTLIYNKIFYITLDKEVLPNENKKKIESIANTTTKIYSKLLYDCDDNELCERKVKKTTHFIDLVTLKDIEITKLLAVIELFIKKINKYPNFLNKHISMNIYNSNFDTLITTHSPNKIINWLFTNTIN